MSEPTTRRADSLSLDELTTVFNDAFEGYFVPMYLTADSLAGMMATNDVKLEHSLILEAPDGERIGVALLGIRGERCWIAGMGIAPKWRYQRLGDLLLRQLIEHARALSLRHMLLDVLEQNQAAQRLYSRFGFQVIRPLPIYAGSLTFPDAPPGAHDASATIAPISPSDALSRFEAFHPVAPTWQRERASLLHMSLQGLALWRAGEHRASLLFNEASGGYALLDLGSCAPTADERRADGVALLRALISATPNALVRAIKSPPGDPLGETLRYLHCPLGALQREMALDL